jgi:hypothetical protein
MKHDLQARLALSLDQANRREKKAQRQAPATAALTAERRCTKLSVSLFAGDLARLQAIRSYMAQRGAMLSTSQAVKLALRTAAPSPDMDKALAAIRSEDGRKW